LRNARNPAYLTGQRPKDVLKATSADIKHGVVWVSQGKISAKLRVAIKGELPTLIEGASAAGW
jgi:hypothetical protein